MAFLGERYTVRKTRARADAASETLISTSRLITLLITFMVFLVFLPVRAWTVQLVIGFSGKTGSNDIFLGAQLGIDESNRQGKYFEKELLLKPGEPEDRGSINFWILGDNPSIDLPSDVLIMDAHSTSDEERERCHALQFFSAPSETMLARAMSAFVVSGYTGDSKEVEILAWHHTLFKYAARDLNRRYKDRFGVEMTSQAWSGWAAARLLGEAWIRGSKPRPDSFAKFFLDSVSFDGQKGVALSFTETGQLRQVLFPVLLGKVLSEIPRGKETIKKLDNLSALKCVNR